jgi:hypothetical protein
MRAMSRLTACVAAVIAALSIALAVSASRAVADPACSPFGIVPGSFSVVPSTLQAGAHEDLTTKFDFEGSGGKTCGDVRTIVVRLPPGMVGSAEATPTCRASDLLAQHGKGSECPPDTQVGTLRLTLAIQTVPVKVEFGIYNMEVTTPGVAAELGFNAFIFTGIMPISVRSAGAQNLALTVTTPDIENIGETHAVTADIWGVPGAAEHDAERGQQCVPVPLFEPIATCEGGGHAFSGIPKPFLSMPTRCTAAPLVAEMEAESWEEPGRWSKASADVGPLIECDRVPFGPGLEAVPSTDAVESPSGFDLSLLVPQTWDKPEVTATADLEDTSVTFPEGYTVNPSAGAGLEACTAEELDAESASSPPGAGCPLASKIGTVEATTPLLAEHAEGAIYVAQPPVPFAGVLPLYIVVKIPERGVLVKLAGETQLNPLTGQLVTTFDESPEAPFERFTLRLRQGATSPLVSPPRCGTYTLQAALTPWSAPGSASLLAEPFTIDRGIRGAPCSAGAVPPFAPLVVAGTANNAAGRYSPFYLRVSREDGEQEITRFSTTLAPGVTGNLNGITFCSDAAIEAARTQTGAGELSRPSCPAASELGHSLAGAGVGGTLVWTPGKIYLAGPYHGAGLSLVSITSAKVGPFDLGTVVVRFALRVNPATAQIEIDPDRSDPIPHIIHGVVVHLRELHVYIDRPNFTLNPTSCARMSIANSITGAGADPANAADQQTVAVATPFQAADCQALGFKPRFTAFVTGRTSKANGAGLTVKLAFPGGSLGSEANVRSVKVALPLQLPSRLTTLQKACRDTTFNANPASCPAASIVGHAVAHTPILPVALAGPAYFVSHGGAKFPELVLVLQGYGITIDLRGETFISKKGITTSTFRTVPDQPVTSFELTLPQGPFSALAANGDLCHPTRTVVHRRRVQRNQRAATVRTRSNVPVKLAMPTIFTAQNGRVVTQTTTIVPLGCPRHHTKRHHAKQKPGRRHP